MNWNWIRTTDRLPDHDNPVLICCRDYGDGPAFFIAYYDRTKWRENTDGRAFGPKANGDVTHWCELQWPPDVQRSPNFKLPEGPK